MTAITEHPHKGAGEVLRATREGAGTSRALGAGARPAL